MKGSVVHHFKSLTNRIHPQVALSEKESQRLVNALTSSFNHHLDHKLPLTGKASFDITTRQSSVSKSSSASSASSTHLHLASILTNPLFARPLADSATSTTIQARLDSKSEHPIKVFEDAVASGQASLETARLCLVAFRSSLKGLTASEQTAQLNTWQAGTRALRWLWSSGNTNHLAFTEDWTLLENLVFFLHREGDDAAVWNLIVAPISLKSGSHIHRETDTVRWRKGEILRALLKAQVLGGSMSDAIATFLRAIDTVDTEQQSPLLAAAGTYLIRLYFKYQSLGTQPVSRASYDRFVESFKQAPARGTMSAEKVLFTVANLKLHHPYSPSAEEALTFIRELKRSPKHPFLSPITEIQRRAVYKFFSDTVRVLHKQYSGEDAAWVVEFVQKSFPDKAVNGAKGGVLLSTTPLPASSSALREKPVDQHTGSSSNPVSWRMANFGLEPAPGWNRSG